METDIKRILFFGYFVFVDVLLLLYLFGILYEEALKESMFLDYLPDSIVIPQYDMETGLIANAEEVTLWSYWDHVPWYGMFCYNLAGFATSYGVLLFLVVLLLLIPIGVLNIKKELWIYWSILLIALLLSWFLTKHIVLNYW
jgi:hypothetical protein